MFFGFGLLRLLIWFAEIVIGIGLIINCIRGLKSGEGMYDRDNTNYMVVAQIGGILLGIFLLCHALGLVQVPFL